VSRALAAFGAPNGAYHRFTAARAAGQSTAESFPLLASALPEAAWDAPALQDVQAALPPEPPATPPGPPPAEQKRVVAPEARPGPLRVVPLPAAPVPTPGVASQVRAVSRNTPTPPATSAERSSDSQPLADVFRILRGEAPSTAGSDGDNRLQDMFRRL
jgi:hypothetical protein